MSEEVADDVVIIPNDDGTMGATVFKRGLVSPSVWEEVRHTDPVTGAQKGKKLAQVGALDPLAILKVGEVAGFGAEKYDRFNFLKGFPYHWSYDALQRHLNLFWAGEDIDEESGLPHMAHAAWQCLALLSFQLREKGTDDRPHTVFDVPTTSTEG